MEHAKASILSTGCPELGSQFQKWYARTAVEESYPGKVRPGIYLVSVRGKHDFYALPVSPSLLETIRQAAVNPDDKKEVSLLTSGGCHDRNKTN